MTKIEPHVFTARPAPAGPGGGALPVVALHSSASTGGQWRDLAALFADRRPVLTPDLPGYGLAAVEAGGAGVPSGDALAPETLAGEAEGVLRTVGVAAPALHLVGHSYGGAVALKIALTYPWRVRSLTLIEPVVFHLLAQGGERDSADMRLYRGILGVRDRLRGAVAAGWPAHGMAAFVDFWNGAGAWDRTGTEQRQHLAGQARVVLRNFAAVLGESWTLPAVARLGMPLLTITGERSPEVTQRLTEKLVDTAGDVTAARVFAAGHMAPLTHAATVNSFIERHVRVTEEREMSALRRAAFHGSPAAA